MNIENIKSQFPIFSKKINGKPLVYLDSSNSSQKPMCVINRLNDFYKNEFSNIGRSIHSLAINATNKFEETRISVKNFINANSREEIIFTKNGTEAINLVATTFGQQNIEKGDEIIITELEHHSNYVPWHFLRETRGAIIKFAPINEDGDIIIDKLKDVLYNESDKKVFDKEHIKGARHIPLSEVTSREIRDSELIVYSERGEDSVEAARILSARGYSVWNLEGGVVFWIRAGYEVVND